jgi:hypothetical protein
MLLNMKPGAPRRLCGHSVNAAVTNIGGGAALKADEMVMMRWFARDVGVAPIRKVEALHKALLCKKFKETQQIEEVTSTLREYQGAEFVAELEKIIEQHQSK